MKLPLELKLVEQHTGQTRIDSVEAAEAELAAAKAAHKEAASRHRVLARQLLRAELIELWRRFRVGYARFPARHHIPPWIVLLVSCSIAAFTLAMIAILISEAGLTLVLICGIAPFAAFAFYGSIFPADLSQLISKAERAREKVTTLKPHPAATRAALATAHRQLTEASRIHVGLLKASHVEASASPPDDNTTKIS